VLAAAGDVPAERHLGWFGAELVPPRQRRESSGLAGLSI
jgi:hypothetical protein